MYSFVSATVLPRSLGAQFTTKDISAMLVEDIYLNYSEIYLTVLNSISVPTPTNVYIDFNACKERAQFFKGTLNQYFSMLNSNQLPTVTHIPSANIIYAKYSDAFQIGYKLNLAKFNHVTLQDPKVDLIVNRAVPITDSTLVDKNCLVTVNGYLHRTTNDGTNTYILDGATTMAVSNNNQVGILDFTDVGTLTKLSINTNWITSAGSGVSLKDKLYINIPTSTIDLTNKTVMLSLGGYLVRVQPNTFYQTGIQTFCLDITSIPVIERYYESAKYLDMSSLGLTLNVNMPTAINVQEFLSDAKIVKYLTMSQSFLIVINNPSMWAERFALENGKLPGMYIAYSDPHYPLFTGYGRMPEYWKSYEDHKWSVVVEDGFKRNYDFSTVPLSELQIVTSGLIPTKPREYSEAYFLQIGGIKQ